METLNLNGKQSFAFYSLPNQTEVNAVVNFDSSKSETINLKEVNASQGFVFAPFINKEEIQFISGEKISSVNLDKVSYSFENKKDIGLNFIDYSSYSSSFESYIKAFDESFSKAILSRPIDVEVPKNINPIQLIEKLNKHYPSAFVYCLYTSDFGLWVGASPEVLLSESDEDFETVALAGTQLYKENLEWSDKEREEQAIVESYITEELESLDVLFFKGVVSTVQAGDLAHLKTTFFINKTAEYSDLVDVLHPTPAVCGMPKDDALNLISENEHYNRELYTGFLGPSFEHTQLFVNLRCMQLFQDKARIYVGGGITKNSDVQEEWNETELKAQTMLSILEKNRTLHS